MKSLYSLMLVLLFAVPVFAQQVVFDKGVQTGDLQLFPLVGDDNSYYYLADKVQLAKHADGKPYFSFIKYVRNEDTDGTNPNGITESNKAGGVIHALVALDVPNDMVREAEQYLQRVNPQAKIKGPIIYKSGRIALISSIADESNSEFTRKVVGVGNAPLVEGHKAAISIFLTKEGADILWATFQTPTPDISFQLEMEVAGYQSPKQVKIEADFEQIYKNKTIDAAAVTPVFSGEIKASFDELSNTGAIKVTQIGTDADLTKLKETAYNQLINLMFDKVGSQDVGTLSKLMPNSNKSMLERATERLNVARKEAKEENDKREKAAKEQAVAEAAAKEKARAAIVAKQKEKGVKAPPMKDENKEENKKKEVKKASVPSLAIGASYSLKEVKRKGKYIIDLNKYTEDKRTFPFSENVGNILKDCKECLLRINLDDPLYKQREVLVNLIDVNDDDFGQYIGSVEVLMEKTHQNGQSTVQNIVVDRNRFNADANNFRMIYGWKGDDDRPKWLNYKYKTKWAFSGGSIIEEDWKTVDFGAIDLVPPLVKKDVYVELDPDFAEEENIRAAEVKIYFKNGKKDDTRSVTLRTRDEILSKSVQLILPQGVDDYEYEVTWFIKGKSPSKKLRTKYNYGSIYLDSF
jgi:hypothetical protein